MKKLLFVVGFIFSVTLANAQVMSAKAQTVVIKSANLRCWQCSELLDKYGMVTKQRIEITKQMEFKNLYTSQIENKGSTQVQNIFTNIGNIFNISELDTPTSIIGIAEEVENYGK